MQPRLYRYELSYFTGYTFMMQFMAMRARTWRDILGRREGEGLSEFVARHRAAMPELSGNYTWDLDQHIATRAILGSGLCSVPGDSKLWREVNLKPR